MSNIVQVDTRPNLVAGGKVSAIIPQSMDEAYRLAKAVCFAGMNPKGMDTPEKCMIAIMRGMEVGLTPFQALDKIAVVNGRPTIWGDGAVGLVRGSGLCEFIKESTTGTADARTATCEAKRRGEKEAITRTFSVADAKKAGLWGKSGPWQQFPDRMLQMRARAFALRDLFADVLGGLYLREEIEDDTVQSSRAPPPPVEHERQPVAAIEPPRAARIPPPPPPPAAEAMIDPVALQEKFATALSIADDEDSANNAYVAIIGPHEHGLAESEQEEFLMMLRNRVAELEP